MTAIRPALPEDAAAVAACVRAAYAGYVALIGREPAPMGADYAALIAAAAVWVAHDAAEVVGVLVLHERGAALLIENVAVHPSRQGRGIGRALVAFAEEQARAAGLAEVTLYTNARMTANLRFYPALGYAETGRRAEDGFDRVFYRKRLWSS
jgi:ribosomal protein S18 acetylase RimI-like enzyme